MNALRNKVQLIGNLGMNPEIKTLSGDKKLAKMSIATNESYKAIAIGRGKMPADKVI